MFNFGIQIGWGLMILLIGGFIALNVFAYFVARKRARFPKPNIAVVSLSGVIKYSEKPGSGFKKFLSQLEIVERIKPKALILRVNSPGGAAGASHQIYSALRVLRYKKKIPIVALMEDMAASGGVYVAMAADKIVATPGTVTGSIGVIIPHFDASSILRAVGLKVEHVKIGENKDMLSMSKPMTQMARDIAEEAIADTYDAFCEVVADGRRLPLEKVREFADGRILSAKRAKEVGLIDEVGSYETALKLAKEMGGVADGDERIYEITPPVPLLERLGLAPPGLSALSQQVENLAMDAELSGLPLWFYKR